MHNIEILRGGALNRRRWVFSFYVDIGSGEVLYLDTYAVEYIDNARQKKWRNSKIWTRLNRRDNTLANPELPAGIVEEAKERIIERIKTLSATI